MTTINVDLVCFIKKTVLFGIDTKIDNNFYFSSYIDNFFARLDQGFEYSDDDSEMIVQDVSDISQSNFIKEQAIEKQLSDDSFPWIQSDFDNAERLTEVAKIKEGVIKQFFEIAKVKTKETEFIYYPLSYKVTGEKTAKDYMSFFNKKINLTKFENINREEGQDELLTIRIHTPLPSRFKQFKEHPCFLVRVEIEKTPTFLVIPVGVSLETILFEKNMDNALEKSKNCAEWLCDQIKDCCPCKIF